MNSSTKKLINSSTKKSTNSLDLNQFLQISKTFLQKYLEVSRKVCTFASAFENETKMKHSSGRKKEAFFEKDLHKTEVVQEACMAF